MRLATSRYRSPFILMMLLIVAGAGRADDAVVVDAHLRATMNRYARVAVRVDLSRLPESERTALAQLVEAARLWAHEDLIERGILDRSGSAALYPAFIAAALARLRGGVSSPQSRGSTVLLNRIMDAGGIRVSPKGTLLVDAVNASASVRTQIRDFVAAQAAGDVGAVRAMFEQYAVVRPELRPIVERLKKVKSGVWPVFVTAAELAP